MLMHVALRAPAISTVGEVAQDFGLSATHLNKVAQTLAAHGYLQTLRGRSGGLRLLQEPKSIRLGAVALATEPDFHIASCIARRWKLSDLRTMRSPRYSVGRSRFFRCGA
jgi:Rrf2 family nitric oxide-sensitive transcriptional repressor